MKVLLALSEKDESDLADAKRKGKTPSTSLSLKPQGRPFLLGEIH